MVQRLYSSATSYREIFITDLNVALDTRTSTIETAGSSGIVTYSNGIPKQTRWRFTLLEPSWISASSTLQTLKNAAYVPRIQDTINNFDARVQPVGEISIRPTKRRGLPSRFELTFEGIVQ